MAAGSQLAGRRLQVGEFFDGLPPGELRYVPNGFMRERYPDDYP
jgi:hypothetical protein